MKTKIAYTLVDKKGKVIVCQLDNGLYIYNTKRQALQNCEEDEKVIKVSIEPYQK